MKRRHPIPILALGGSLVLILVLLAACTGIKQADYDAVKQQLSAEQQKTASFQQQLSAKVQEVAAKDKAVADAQAKATAAEKQAADLQQKLGASAGVTMLQGAKQYPTPTPRPTATPLPPGVPTPTAAPARRVPPEVANEVLPFVFYVENLATTSLGIDGWASIVPCVPNTVFKRGMKFVLRVEIVDTSTGKRVTDLDGAKIVVKIPGVDDITMRYSPRGGTGPWTWAAGWNIPLDYPLGALDYNIVVTTKDGRTGVFDQDKLALVRAATATAAGIDSRVQIIN